MKILDKAASPLANARPRAPSSSDAMHVSNAKRVGFELREYSNPLCPPKPSCAYVVVKCTGVTTAFVEGSGAWPTCKARVSNASPPDAEREGLLGLDARDERLGGMKGANEGRGLEGMARG